VGVSALVSSNANAYSRSFRAFKSGAHSDLTIQCQGKVFKAHKLVLCEQSSFFDKAVKDGRFKVCRITILTHPVRAEES
jgi:BTB/POZ domain